MPFLSWRVKFAKSGSLHLDSPAEMRRILVMKYFATLPTKLDTWETCFVHIPRRQLPICFFQFSTASYSSSWRMTLNLHAICSFTLLTIQFHSQLSKWNNNIEANFVEKQRWNFQLESILSLSQCGRYLEYVMVKRLKSFKAVRPSALGQNCVPWLSCSILQCIL